jgi:hypothetical protein
MRFSRSTVWWVSAAWMLAVCQPGAAQLTQPQQIYEQAIGALFREDVDMFRPQIVDVRTTSATWPRRSDSGSPWARFPDSSYRARYSDTSGPRLVWGDVPPELRESFRRVAEGEIKIRSQDLPPNTRLIADNSSARAQVSLSAIAFAADSSEALVYLHVHCGGLCGGGDIVYLRKRPPNTWSVVATFPLWRS